MYSKNNSRSSKNVVCGRNPVLELLKAARRTVNKIMVSRTARGVVISEIINLAKQKGIALHSVPPEKLDKFSESSQGIVAEVSPVQYTELSDLIERSKKSLKPLLVILDGLEDPHNLGAIIRNCVAFGADGVIIPKWRAAGVNETVSKSSAGAVEHISISRVENTNQAIGLLKENSFWIVGAENGGRILEKIDLPFPLAVIIGSEGFGLHSLTKKNSDFLISIPQENIISSLNASCASAVILYEIAKKRKIS
ncbi:23S rRNA (guanosine(2251)-2'-O)-methyltransferase RlmB [Endomicrobiia bacterium]|nr:23S rRNA (guanosine(2251)-2'-O)-methyltransferase RlmB [Endomicrobiia bacterium]GHT20641.1 23S rRNA (guanosine(2251)-2'-O)-methyltransferase RlmB [Endomicrobiia bacterium]GHT26227.1 23S rRNA (guanosine(2251)-2'-O)-methyltransferase RlmB [Endomicrobiia bacterium]GHT31643.1 23S rRNA (guanosine(2251)-2'-O)-methyltransferase RlmB [Endomicrobiia bacterium]